MRIEYVVTGLSVGGAEMQVRDLALGMRERGHEVGVLSLLEPRAHVQALESARIVVATLGLEQARATPARMAGALLRARRHIVARGADVVHAHMVHANILMRLVRFSLPSMRLACTIHSTNEGGHLRDLAYRFTGRGVLLNTTVSKASTARFVSAGALPASTRTVYNGIDCSRFAASQPRMHAEAPFRWLAAGRLEKEKQFATVLAAISRLAGCTLDIAGEGREGDRLRELARRCGVCDRVRFLGVVPDVATIMGHYDAFVLSSEWEGFGLVVAEAMASGLPVVVTDSGGPKEIVGEDETRGLVVPTLSSEALAEAMGRLMTLDDAARRCMGARGREYVRARFDKAAWLDRWESLYSEMLADRPRKA